MRIKNFLSEEHGFLMLNVIFLTLITSLLATILFNAAPRVKNPHSTLRLTALYLANEQFAQLESLAAAGEELPKNFLGKEEDRITKNFSEKKPIEFEVTTEIERNGNLRKVTVTVKWSVDGKISEIKSERTILFVPKNNL